jgi:hypothetical protein
MQEVMTHASLVSISLQELDPNTLALDHALELVLRFQAVGLTRLAKVRELCTR